MRRLLWWILFAVSVALGVLDVVAIVGVIQKQVEGQAKMSATIAGLVIALAVAVVVFLLGTWSERRARGLGSRRPAGSTERVVDMMTALERAVGSTDESAADRDIGEPQIKPAGDLSKIAPIGLPGMSTVGRKDEDEDELPEAADTAPADPEAKKSSRKTRLAGIFRARRRVGRRPGDRGRTGE